MTDILVAGSAAIDFLFEVDAMPTKAEKYRAHNAQIVGGGCAANAAVAITRLGGTAHLAARLGDDPVGLMIEAGLQSDGVNTALTSKTSGATSSYSSVYVDPQGERQIMNFRGADLADNATWTLPKLDGVLADTRWAEGAISAMQAAQTQQIPGVMDAEAPLVPEALHLASHIAFSRQGLTSFAPEADTTTALTQAAKTFNAWVCVTDGADGVTWTDGTRHGHVSTPQVTVLDTLGAGDVWHGAFTLSLAQGASEITSIQFANAAAALKCTRSGGRTGSPTLTELHNFLKETSHATQPR